MPRTEEANQRIREEQRAKILDGARKVFARKGLAAGERLDFLISSAWEGRREHPEFYQLMYQVLSDEAAPDNLRELIDRQGQAYRDVMRQLIVEGQAAGEVAEGDPDQMVIVVLACLDGLSRLVLWDSERVKKHFPDAGLLLRMLKTHSDQK